MSKFNIGIISERYQNDGEPVAYLLEQYFPEKAEYTQVLKKFTGSQLNTENKEFFRLLSEILYDEEYLDFVVIIKDLDEDGEEEKIKAFFKDCDTRLDGNMVSLCFVYMIEALAMADLEAVCKHYKKDFKKIKINTKVRHAKNELIKIFGYRESDIRDLVRKFDTNILVQNYPTWQNFITKFEQKLTHLIMR